MSNYYSKILERIKYLVEVEKRSDFIIYPFGESGRLAKSILNAYFGLQEFMIIDNKLAEEYPIIQKVDSLKNVSLEDKTLLFTSNNYSINERLIAQLKQVVSECEIVELFPEMELSDEETGKTRRKQLLLEKVRREELAENGMCYSPKNTKSRFFLPYVNMDAIQSIILLSDNYFEIDMLEKIFTGYKDGKIAKDVKDGVVLDIGANIGNHTLYFANELDVAKVISFEPVEETFWILNQNIKLNNLQEKVELHCEGVSNISGKAMVGTYDYQNIGATPLALKKDGDINLVSVDEFEFDNVVFIKMDVEGMELNALKGAYKTIKRNHPYILVESFGSNFAEVKAFLSDLGYDGYLELECSNYLFVYEN